MKKNLTKVEELEDKIYALSIWLCIMVLLMFVTTVISLTIIIAYKNAITRIVGGLIFTAVPAIILKLDLTRDKYVDELSSELRDLYLKK